MPKEIKDMNSFEVLDEIFRAKRLGDTRRLHESTLARIWQRTQKAKDEGFAILTSWRGEEIVEPEVDEKNFKELKKTLRAKTQEQAKTRGFFEILGHWPHPRTGKIMDEPSLVVTGITKDETVALGKKYNQEAVIYAGPETNGMITQIDCETGKTTDIGEFHPNSIGNAYSELLRSKRQALRTFLFSQEKLKPNKKLGFKALDKLAAAKTPEEREKIGPEDLKEYVSWPVPQSFWEAMALEEFNRRFLKNMLKKNDD